MSEYQESISKIISNIKNKLDNKGETVSVAESLTSGMIQESFAKVSGISSCFEGGLTAYSLKAKVAHLHVQKEHAELVNCVSEQVALEMAKGARDMFSTELSISTTGYAEPYEPEGISEPIAFVAINYKGNEIVKSITLPKEMSEYVNPRDAMRKHVTKEALVLALEELK